MSCDDTLGRRTDWLNNNLEKNEQMAINRHLAGCVRCQEEFAADRQIWNNLARIRVPEPSEAMRTGFYTMLDEFKQSEKASPRASLWGITQGIRDAVKSHRLPQGWLPQRWLPQRWLPQRWLPQHPQPMQWTVPAWTIQLAFSLLLVGLGWVIGSRTGRGNRTDATAYQQQIETLASQVQDMKSTMMLTLLENPSATERLRAVSFTSEIEQADDRVLEALFTTLNNDPNVNVRLVTLEALTQYAGNASVRERLVKSLAQQDSPMVQVALADVMVKLQEKRSVKALRTLLQKEDLNDLVKVKIEQSIKDLS